MAAHGSQHRQTSGVTYFCDACGIAHIDAGGTISDTPDAILGASGIASGIAYAFCSRELAYHITSKTPAQRNARAPYAWTDNVAQPERPVCVRTNSADAFVRAYEAQRTYPHHIGSATVSDFMRFTLAVKVA